MTEKVLTPPPLDRKNALREALLRKRDERQRVFPLSPAQLGIWMQQQLTPGNTAYNMSIAFCLHGLIAENVMHETVEASLRTVIGRHASLRTVFESTDDEPRQRVLEEVALELPRMQLGDDQGDDWEARVKQLCVQQSALAFDLREGPLFRFRLVRINESLHALLATFHHVVMDGWSIGVFVRDFGKAFRSHLHGTEPAFDPLPVSYASHVNRLREVAASDQGRADVEYWSRRLQGAPATLDLPIEFRRPPRNDFRGAIHAFVIPEKVSKDLAEVGRQRGATTFMVVLASFYALLSRICGQDDIVLGVSVSNREERDCRNVIGLFSDILPMRGRVNPDESFVDLLGRVRGECLSDYEHTSASMTTIMQNVQVARATDRNRLFQAGFDFQNTPWPTDVVSDKVSVIDCDTGAAKLDLNFSLSVVQGHFSGVFEYNTHLFSAKAMARIERCYQCLIEAILKYPDLAIDRLPFGAEPPPAQPVIQPATNMLAAIESRAHDYPDAIALEGRGWRYTFNEVDGIAMRVAQSLRSRGIGAGDKVGLFFQREPGFVVALLAAMKIGAVYVPIDPGLPRRRRDHLCDDAGIKLMLTSPERVDDWHGSEPPLLAIDLVPSWPDQSPTTFAPTPATSDPAYIIYTSGTSGEPKGVVVGHGALAAFTHGVQTLFRVEPGDRVLQFASIGFDTSAEEIFPSLLAGATLVFPDDAIGSVSVQQLVASIEEQRISVLNLPTSLWHELVSTMVADADVRLPGCVRLLIIGGEAASPDALAHWQRISGTGVRLLNTYGPTETTVSVTAADLGALPEVSRRLALPIGNPYPHVRIYVLDRHRKPVPMGQYGELYIGGPSLALGYHRRPESTLESFLPDPFVGHPDGRMYRTGDFGRYVEDGSIEFAGRRDGQVKLHGFRIELAEVEAALMRHPRIRHAAATVAGQSADASARLIAAVVLSEGDESITTTQMKAWLGERIPKYMLPASIDVVDRLPLTLNGKLDRKMLAQTFGASASGGHAQSGAVTPEQSMLLEMWREVLGVSNILVSDDFFALGGHSLLLIRLLSRIRRVFGVDLALSEVLETTTVEAMTRLICFSRGHGNGADALPIPSLPRKEEASQNVFRQSFAQQRLWFIYELDPDSSAYNNPSALRVRAPLNADHLHDCLRTLVKRHEILRTVFASGDRGPLQIVLPDATPGFAEHDLRGMSADDRARNLEELIQTDSRTPFDLRNGPLIRVAIIRCSDEEQVLLFNWHHIVTDAWSLQIFVRELAALYANRSATSLAPLPVQYADFAEWEHGLVESTTSTGSLDYWRNQLGLLPDPLHAGWSGAAASQRQPAGRHPMRIGSAQVEALRIVARNTGTTLFMACLAVYKLLLARIHDRDDVVVGSPISMRGHENLESVVGYFLNTLALRSDLSGTGTFRALLELVRRTALDAYAHRDVPYERVVQAVQAEQGVSVLFDVSFVLENGSELAGEFGGGRVEMLPRGGQEPKFALLLSMREDREGLVGEWEYDQDIYASSDLEGFSNAYLYLDGGGPCGPLLPQRRPGALERGWLAGIPGAFGRPGEGARLSRGTGGSGAGAAHGTGRGRGGGDRARGSRRTAPGGLRGGIDGCPGSGQLGGRLAGAAAGEVAELHGAGDADATGSAAHDGQRQAGRARAAGER
ncbi:hypothetical protein GCM10027066_01000 [Dyella jejuensis]